jgi:hypothetical protein
VERHGVLIALNTVNTTTTTTLALVGVHPSQLVRREAQLVVADKRSHAKCRG